MNNFQYQLILWLLLCTFLSCKNEVKKYKLNVYSTNFVFGENYKFDEDTTIYSPPIGYGMDNTGYDDRAIISLYENDKRYKFVGGFKLYNFKIKQLKLNGVISDSIYIESINDNKLKQINLNEIKNEDEFYFGDLIIYYIKCDSSFTISIKDLRYF